MKVVECLVIWISLVSIYKCNENMKFLEAFHDYNMYVLSIQLPTTICFTTPNDCDEKMKSVPKNVMTLHGLWPSVLGEKLEDCNTGKHIDIVFPDSQFNITMNRYWPSLMGPNKYFWDHEYNKHGYCWVIKYDRTDPDDFFRMTIGLYKDKDLDQILIKGGFDLTPGKQSFTYNELRTKFDKVVYHNFDMHCIDYSNEQYLIDIYLYLDLNFRSLDSHKGLTSCDKNKPINLIFR